MARRSFTPAEAAARTACAVLGGYALAACFTAFLSRALPAAAVLAPSDAVLTASMLSFIVYLAVTLRVFALRRVRRAIAETLAVSAAFATAAALLPAPAGAPDHPAARQPLASRSPP